MNVLHAFLGLQRQSVNECIAGLEEQGDTSLSEAEEATERHNVAALSLTSTLQIL